jgi:hypothetical protein
MLNHGFRRLHKFVFQRFLNLIRYKQLRTDLNSNGFFQLLLLPGLCFCVQGSRHSESVYIFPPVVLHPKHWNVIGK